MPSIEHTKAKRSELFVFPALRCVRHSRSHCIHRTRLGLRQNHAHREFSNKLRLIASILGGVVERESSPLFMTVYD